MYKLMKQVEYDEDSRWLVEAVYTDTLNEPVLLGTPCYDQDTNVRWWRVSLNVVKYDARDDYKVFELVKHTGERWVVFDKEGDIVLQCDDETLLKIDMCYGSIENYLKTQQTELGF